MVEFSMWRFRTILCITMLCLIGSLYWIELSGLGSLQQQNNGIRKLSSQKPVLFGPLSNPSKLSNLSVGWLLITGLLLRQCYPWLQNILFCEIHGKNLKVVWVTQRLVASKSLKKLVCFTLLPIRKVLQLCWILLTKSYVCLSLMS